MIGFYFTIKMKSYYTSKCASIICMFVIFTEQKARFNSIPLRRLGCEMAMRSVYCLESLSSTHKYGSAGNDISRPLH